MTTDRRTAAGQRTSGRGIARPRLAAVAALVLALVVALGACGSSNGGSDGSTLVGDWTLTSYTNAGGTSAAASRPATATFTTDGKVTGTTGCNRFGGRYSTAGKDLKFEGTGMTAAACLDDAVTAQETAFTVAFSKQQTFSITGDRLTIAATDGVTSLTFARG